MLGLARGLGLRCGEVAWGGEEEAEGAGGNTCEDLGGRTLRDVSSEEGVLTCVREVDISGRRSVE